MIEKPNVPSIVSPGCTDGMSIAKLSRTGWPPDSSAIVASRRATSSPVFSNVAAISRSP